MPDRRADDKRITPTLEEWRVIKTERLRSQRAAATVAGFDNVYEFFSTEGTDHRIDLLSRDRDGSLRVRISIFSPSLQRPYRRRIRLIQEVRMNLG